MSGWGSAFPWNAPWRCCRITTTTGAPINSAEFPADQGHGYLWRLSNYWRLEEKEGGVYMQVESIALSRDVPAIFAWFVNPLIRRTSRQTLANLLYATRRGLVSQHEVLLHVADKTHLAALRLQHHCFLPSLRDRPKRSERRRNAGIIPDHIRAIGRIHLNGRAGAKARIVDRAVAGNDLARSGMRDFDHLVVELVGDQCVAVGKPHRACRQGRRIAARTRVGGVLPDRTVLGIDFDNAVVVGVGEQRVAVGQPTRESDTADGAPGGKRLDDLARSGVRNLDRAVVVLVRDKNIAVGQQLGVVGIVELVVAIAHDAILPILPHDRVVDAPHFDDPLIALIGDEHVSARQISVLHRRVELVGAEAGDAELAILPNDVEIGRASGRERG